MAEPLTLIMVWNVKFEKVQTCRLHNEDETTSIYSNRVA